MYLINITNLLKNNQILAALLRQTSTQPVRDPRESGTGQRISDRVLTVIKISIVLVFYGLTF
jgi:hypothetical protein